MKARRDELGADRAAHHDTEAAEKLASAISSDAAGRQQLAREQLTHGALGQRLSYIELARARAGQTALHGPIAQRVLQSQEAAPESTAASLGGGASSAGGAPPVDAMPLLAQMAAQLQALSGQVAALTAAQQQPTVPKAGAAGVP